MRLIDADELLKENFTETFIDPLDQPVFEWIIEQTPTIDAVPVKHGRWEFIGDDYANCSNCGTIFETRPTPYFFEANNKFCRHCGADMRGE
jgi:hypothetical protein